MRLLPCLALLVLLLPLVVGGCSKPERYTTQVEVLQVQRFGQDPKAAPGMMDLELKFVECPGDARKIMRGNKAFGQCGAKFKKGDKLTAEIILSYSAEKGGYRDQLVHLDDCPVELDPKEDANYEMFQDCRDLMASGGVVGVHCDRTRSKELLAKCPWLRRK
jgi:hypothetical protein